MNLETYLQNKRRLTDDGRRRRDLCFTCLQPRVTCYCAIVKSFDPKIKFVILIHPIEVRRRIATGRMAHLCLQDSLLLPGHDYSQHGTINALVADPSHHCVVLYPGATSHNLTPLNQVEKAALFPADKKLVIFVIDGTWSTARKMLRHSQNLRHLPRICFVPPRQSTFRVRQQPKPECYSTVEAIHHTLELVGPVRGFDPQNGIHHRLLEVFDHMVEQQLEFIRQSHLSRPQSRHHRAQWRRAHGK